MPPRWPCSVEMQDERAISPVHAPYVHTDDRDAHALAMRIARQVHHGPVLR